MYAVLDRIIVEFVDEEVSKTIVLPDSAKGKSQRGKVVAVGPGRFHDGMRRGVAFSITNNSTWNLAVGDTIIFDKFGGAEFEYNKKKYKSIREEDVLAVISHEGA